MYTLRIVHEDGTQVNLSLGDVYKVVCRHTSYDYFCELFEKLFQRNHIADLDTESDLDTINCKIIIETSDDLIAVYKFNENYIMTEGGKTFDRL